jgi:NhaP-type Na+/H+ and K+/H+ antiporter
MAAFLASPLLIRLVHLMPARFSRYTSLIVSYLGRPGAVTSVLALSVVVQSALAICQYLLARAYARSTRFGRGT